MIVPASKRVIFINEKKLFLSFPPIKFYSFSFSPEAIRGAMFIDNKYYHLPLPNINRGEEICFGEFEPSIDNFFNVSFAFYSEAIFDLMKTENTSNVQIWEQNLRRSYNRNMFLYYKKYYNNFIDCKFILKDVYEIFDQFISQDRFQYYIDHPIEITSPIIVSWFEKN